MFYLKLTKLHHKYLYATVTIVYTLIMFTVETSSSIRLSSLLLRSINPFSSARERISHISGDSTPKIYSQYLGSNKYNETEFKFEAFSRHFNFTSVCRGLPVLSQTEPPEYKWDSCIRWDNGLGRLWGCCSIHSRCFALSNMPKFIDVLCPSGSMWYCSTDLP